MKKVKLKEKYSEENLKKLVNDSINYKEILLKLNLRSAGNNINTIKKYIEKYNICTKHFMERNPIDRFKKNETSSLLTENSNYNRYYLKKRLIDENYLKNECSECGISDYWNGKKLTLQLDHINGIHNDNRIENLRFLCPNCHSQTENYSGKKNKKIKTKKIPVRLSNRKVERPSLDVLLYDVKNIGYSGTGRKYGVSDNAVRKWIKHYQKHNYEHV